MEFLIDLAGPFILIGGLAVVLSGRERAIEAGLGIILAAIGVVILWAAMASPYGSDAGQGFAFGLGLIVIGGTGMLLHRVAVPAE